MEGRKEVIFHVSSSSRSLIRFQVLLVQEICLFCFIHTARMTEGQGSGLKCAAQGTDRQSFWDLLALGQGNPKDLGFPKRCLQGAALTPAEQGRTESICWG